MKMKFESFVKQPIPRGRFEEYAAMARNSKFSGRYFVMDPEKLEHGYDYSDLLQAHRNAELYRTAILDESLPAVMGDASHMLLDHSPFFCRYFWIVDLGRVCYKPACPELREVMLHDLNSELRGAAAKSLGKIGDKRYTSDLISVMREDKKAAGAALRALGDMRDDSALPVLREKFEEARRRFDLAGHAQDGDMVWDQVQEICKLTEIMIRAGGDNKRFVDNWGRYEFRDWVRRHMNSGAEYSTIGRRLRKDEA